jgi:enterochelin esterase-like enzyme
MNLNLQMYAKQFIHLLGFFLIAFSPISSHTAPLGLPLPPSVEIGKIERIVDFQSKYVDSRHIDVWLPNDYTPDKKYAVLYMLDGQSLFDANQAWNKQAWNVHLAINKLTAEKKILDTIVVGIPNGQKYRYSEYFPEKYLTLLPNNIRDEYVRRAQIGRPLSDNFLRFLVEEIKPVIDSKYSTFSKPNGTFIMGSSMGGMISVYALCEYPEIFGGAAALSTHWIGLPTSWGAPKQINNASFPMAAFTYLRKNLPSANTRLIYMDHGTLGVDAIYGSYQTIVDQIGKEIGYEVSHWKSAVFEGAEHNERDWSVRVDIPLLFLLGKH